MTLAKFKTLHEYEQEEIVFHSGIFLKNYVIKDYICDAYQLGSFYVIFSYSLNYQNGATLKAFTDPGKLPFLNEIGIPNF
jgi:hypothetical protein